MGNGQFNGTCWHEGCEKRTARGSRACVEHNNAPETPMRRAEYGTATETILLKLDPELLRQLRRCAELSGATASAYAREAIAARVLRDEAERRGV